MDSKLFIITPVYCSKNNQQLERFLECAESVKNQQNPNVVHLIVDDGSTHPQMESVLNRINKSSQVIVHRTKNQGVIKALNFLTERLKDHAGHEDYVMRLNSDDLLPPNAANTCLKTTENEESPAVIFGPALVYYETWDRLELVPIPKIEKHYHLWRHLVEHRPFPHLSTAWRVDFFHKYVGVLDEKIKYSEDWDQAVRTTKGLLDSNERYHTIQNILYLFRKDDNSLGNKQLSDIKGKINSYNEILKKQVSGTDYHLQSFRNVVRLLRIKLGLKFKREWRNVFMPRFSISISPKNVDSTIIDFLQKQKTCKVIYK